MKNTIVIASAATSEIRATELYDYSGRPIETQNIERYNGAIASYVRHTVPVELPPEQLVQYLVVRDAPREPGSFHYKFQINSSR